jgi:hypothetical protein
MSIDTTTIDSNPTSVENTSNVVEQSPSVNQPEETSLNGIECNITGPPSNIEKPPIVHQVPSNDEEDDEEEEEESDEEEDDESDEESDEEEDDIYVVFLDDRVIKYHPDESKALELATYMKNQIVVRNCGQYTVDVDEWDDGFDIHLRSKHLFFTNTRTRELRVVRVPKISI